MKRTDATEDDDFGDFEGPEDDAPESVQAMGGPPNWVFPGLLSSDLLIKVSDSYLMFRSLTRSVKSVTRRAGECVQYEYGFS